MPNCFQLTRKSDLSAGPVSLMKIDKEMCAHFNAPVDPVKYHAYWYDIIGFSLAMGRSFGDQRAEFKEQLIKLSEKQEDLYHAAEVQHLLDVCNWLDANFISDAFYSMR